MNTTENTEDKINVYAGGVNEKYHQFIVKTTIKEINDLLKSYEDYDDALVRHMFISTSRELNKYTVEELVKHADDNTKEYGDWNNDVVIFYVAKFLLFNVPIPIIK